MKYIKELKNDQFAIEKFQDSNSDISFYTGFPNYTTLLSCFSFLNPGDHGENILYVTGNSGGHFQLQLNPADETAVKKGRRRKLSTFNEFFMVYC